MQGTAEAIQKLEGWERILGSLNMMKEPVRVALAALREKQERERRESGMSKEEFVEALGRLLTYADPGIRKLELSGTGEDVTIFYSNGRSPRNVNVAGANTRLALAEKVTGVCRL